MTKKSKDKDRQEKRKEREELTLEMKVRAMKLLKIDKYEPEDILTDLESTFGLKILDSGWKNPELFLRRIEKSVIGLVLKSGPHTQRLLKLLTQAQLVDITGDKNDKPSK